MEREKITLGSIDIDIVANESVSEAVDITQYPVEKGVDITDHAKDKPTMFTITGVFVHEDAPTKLQQLTKYRKDKTLLRYQGRNIVNNLIIARVERNHNYTNLYGFAYDITLQQIRIAELQKVNVKVAQKTKKVTKKGTQTTKKSKASAATTKKSYEKVAVYRKGVLHESI